MSGNRKKKGKEKTKRVWKQEKTKLSKKRINEMCQLEDVLVPFGRRVEECTFRNIYTCIGYIQPTIGGHVSVITRTNTTT